MKIGFDMDKYYELQIQEINKRIERFGERLYLEIGGKLFDDMHAARVIPGFDPNAKINIFNRLKDKVEIVFCISSKDITSNKMRGDNDLTYGADVLRQIDQFRKRGFWVSAIVITLFEGQQEAMKYKRMLEQRGETVYVHTRTKGYPTDIETIVSEEGYGKNEYIRVKRELVVVTAPGPGSAKLGTCLSQLYHDNKKGIKAGYSKIETFPVWDLPLSHPVNVAYEAGTLDLKDVNMIDPFHFYAYGKTAINYNRDIGEFPLLRRIFQKISKAGAVFKSPTEMGVNCISKCITDDELVKRAARREILRRYMNALVSNKNGELDFSVVERAKQLLDDVGINEVDRPVIEQARQKGKESSCPAMAIQLNDENETIVTGRETEDVTAACSVVLNAIKYLAKIGDKHKFIPENTVKLIVGLKTKLLKSASIKLDLKDALTILATERESNSTTAKAYQKIKELQGCEAHSTFIVNGQDRKILKKLGLNLTCDPVYATSELYVN